MQNSVLNIINKSLVVTGKAMANAILIINADQNVVFPGTQV